MSSENITENETILLEVLGSHGSALHYTMIGRIARGSFRAKMTDRQALSILSRSRRFSKLDEGIYWLEGKSQGKRYDLDELVESDNG